MSATNTTSTNVPTETFRCDHCGEERPIAERERFGPQDWCTPCVDHVDVPNDLD